MKLDPGCGGYRLRRVPAVNDLSSSSSQESDDVDISDLSEEDYSDGIDEFPISMDAPPAPRAYKGSLIGDDELLNAWRQSVLKDQYPQVYSLTDPHTSSWAAILFNIDEIVFAGRLGGLAQVLSRCAADCPSSPNERNAVSRALVMLHILKSLGRLNDVSCRSEGQPQMKHLSIAQIETHYVLELSTQLALHGGMAFTLMKQIAKEESVSVARLTNLVASIAVRNRLDWFH